MRYLLDTDTCIDALKGQPEVVDALLRQRRVDVALSVVTEAELRTGATRSSTPKKTLSRLESFLAPLQLLEFTSDDARTYARLRGRLLAEGQPIGPLDTLIAAHALSRELTLVSDNTRDFSRVKGLQLENWRIGETPLSDPSAAG